MKIEHIQYLELLSVFEEYGPATLYELESGEPNVYVKFPASNIAVNLTIEEDGFFHFRSRPIFGYKLYKYGDNKTLDELTIFNSVLNLDIAKIKKSLDDIKSIDNFYLKDRAKDTNEKHKPQTSRSAGDYLKSAKRTIQRTLASWFRKL